MKTVRVLTLCTVAVLGACNRDSGTPVAPKPVTSPHLPVAAKKGPTAEDLTVGMVEAAALGKSQLAVRLKFDLRQRPAVGQALDIDVAVMPQIDAGAAGIQVAGGDGLTVPPGANQIDMPAVEAGQVYRQSLKVTPTEDGVLVLNLTVFLKHDEVTESRAFSIPLVVQR
ncbi:MAG: hypothetical protein WBF89_22250 [Steroidobacteraceae bacterium]